MPVRDLKARRLEDLLSRLAERVHRLEHRRRPTVGDLYVLDVDDEGRLTARNTETGKVTIIAAP